MGVLITSLFLCILCMRYFGFASYDCKIIRYLGKLCPLPETFRFRLRHTLPQYDMKTIATLRHVESEYLLNIEIFLFKAIVLFEGKIIFALAIIYYLIFPEFTIAKKIEMY